MKTNTSLLCRFAAVAALVLPISQSAFAQTTATTTPVGFVTVSIPSSGAQGTPAYTFVALSILNPIAWQSTSTGITTTTTANDTLADSAASWADNAYNSATAGAPPTHFVEVLSTTSGSNVGTLYDIVTTNGAAKKLTVSGAFPSDTQSYAIRPHWTLASVFGTTNQNGLTGGTSVSADQIQLFTGTGYQTYYYKTTTTFGGAGWRSTNSTSADTSTTVIYPTAGILIVNNQATAESVVVSGTVKTGQTSIPVTSGFSLLGNVYSAGMTLGNSNIYTGDPATGLAGGTSVTADQLQFWNGSGFNTYYYKTTTTFGGAGWRSTNSTSVDASATLIPVGAALFVSRAGAWFTWVAPQFPASFN